LLAQSLRVLILPENLDEFKKEDWGHNLWVYRLDDLNRNIWLDSPALGTLRRILLEKPVGLWGTPLIIICTSKKPVSPEAIAFKKHFYKWYHY